jgi:hypothetical protein
MRMCVAPLSAAALFAAAGVAAGDVTLDARMTADNQFTASISTSSTSAGVPFLSGNSWPSTFTGSYVFPGAGTYYLQVQAVDQGVPAMLIGDFGLSGGDAIFINSTTSLATNAADWVVSNTGFGLSAVTPLDLGANGSSPWGMFAAIDPGARFLWAPTYTPTVYFTTIIVVLPAPSGIAAFGVGALAMARRRR